MDYQRPAALYRYASQDALQRALDLGEFRLQPSNQCLTLGFSSVPNPDLFGEQIDCCLIIHQPERFGEQLHRAVQKLLPNWAGIDGAVEYGKRSPLGAVFSKDLSQKQQHEWLFAWRSLQAAARLQPVVVQMGDLRQMAELRSKDSYLN
jgi:hypothetical protein